MQAGGIRFAYRGSDKTLRTPWSSCSIFAAESSLFKMENHRRRRDHKQEGLSTMTTSREIRLKSRIVGAPVADNFELATVSVPAPALGEVQVKNLWMSVDPYMRGRMVDRTSYDPHLPLGEATPARESREARSVKLLHPRTPVLSQAISSRPCLAGGNGSTRLSAPWRS